MYGTEEIRIDSKNRIFLPSFTNAEQGDELLLVKDEEFYSIYNRIYYDELLSKLEEAGDIQKVRYICNNIVKKMIVDSHNRITLGNRFEDEEFIKVIGCRRFVSLEQVKKR